MTSLHESRQRDSQGRRHGAWRTQGAFAYASLDTSSIVFALDCHVWSKNSVRVTARTVSASTGDLAAAPLSLQSVKPRKA